MTPLDDLEYLTVSQVASLFGWSNAKARRLVSQGLLGKRFRQPTGKRYKWLIARSDIQAHMEQLMALEEEKTFGRPH